MSRATARPLSPHLSIWKWGPHMLVSILNRVTGGALATVGTIVFVWWLAALAGGPDSYATFHYWVVKANDASLFGVLTNLFARIVAIGLTWSFFQHFANGVRHFVLDIGAGYELKRNRAGAIGTIVFSVVVTAAMWAYIFSRGIW